MAGRLRLRALHVCRLAWQHSGTPICGGQQQRVVCAVVDVMRLVAALRRPTPSWMWTAGWRRTALVRPCHPVAHLRGLAAPAAVQLQCNSLVPRQAWVERSIGDASKVSISQLDPLVWGAPMRVDVVHSVVRWHLASRRQGTAKTKTVRDVSGTGKKMYRQKGTGRARHGVARVNLFRGGAVVHGKVPRDHSHRLPRKVRQMALRVVLSAKLASGDLIVVEDGTLASHKTKDFLTALSQRDLCGTRTVFVDVTVCGNMALASGNIRNFSVMTASLLSTYDALRSTVVVCTEAAVRELESRLVRT